MLRFLGILFLAIVACVGVALVWALQQDKSARHYVASAVPAIFNEWDFEALNQRSSEQLNKDPQFRAAVPTMFQRLKEALGPLKTVEETQGTAGYGWGDASPADGTYGDYLIRARFERGEAELRLLVVRERSAWKIRGFNINSPALLKLGGEIQARVEEELAGSMQAS